MSALRRPWPHRRAQGERPACGPRREGGGGRRPPEARDGRDRQRATSWQTPRPSPTRWPTAASGRPSASAGTVTPFSGRRARRPARRPTTRGRAPGARANTAPDLRPGVGGAGTVRRDHGKLWRLVAPPLGRPPAGEAAPLQAKHTRARPRRAPQDPGRQAPEGGPDAGRARLTSRRAPPRGYNRPTLTPECTAECGNHCIHSFIPMLSPLCDPKNTGESPRKDLSRQSSSSAPKESCQGTRFRRTSPSHVRLRASV